MVAFRRRPPGPRYWPQRSRPARRAARTAAGPAEHSHRGIDPRVQDRVDRYEREVVADSVVGAHRDRAHVDQHRFDAQVRRGASNADGWLEGQAPALRSGGPQVVAGACGTLVTLGYRSTARSILGCAIEEEDKEDKEEVAEDAEALSA